MGTLLRDGVLLIVLLAPSLVIYHGSLSGDAFVYLTYIRNFFSLPFSFQPGTVTFGATSPLHVLVHAPVAFLGGAGWIAWSRMLNGLLVVAGALALRRALGGGVPTLVLVAALVALDGTLLATAAQLFETGVMFLLVSVLLLFARRGRTEAAAAAAGLLYLVRPELLLSAAAIDLVLVWLSGRPGMVTRRGGTMRRRRTVMAAAAGFAPAAIYHLYMLAMTGRLVPTSVEARAITALEGGRTWLEGLQSSWAAFEGPDGLLYLAGVVGIAVLAARCRSAGWEAGLLAALALALPVALLYLAVPPGSQAPRYLLPVTPVLVVGAAWAIREAGARLASMTARAWTALPLRPVVAGGLAAFVTLALVDAQAWPRVGSPRYDEDTLLLRDLAAQLGPAVGPGDRVLIYEIQAQYVLPAFCLSADAIVGGQALQALLRREPWETFLAREKVRYVVTMESFNYRRIYAGTLLERIYLHDRAARVGDTMEAGGLRFRKVFENPVLGAPGGTGLLAMAGLNGLGTIRVYGPANRLWAGHALLWGAVYEVTPA
jgi:hypothetical protein